MEFPGELMIGDEVVDLFEPIIVLISSPSTSGFSSFNTREGDDLILVDTNTDPGEIIGDESGK